MKLQTASEAISFSKELEEKGAQFYEALAQSFKDYADIFHSFAKENRNFAKQIERTYFSVITDAIEGSYAVDVESDNFDFDTEFSSQSSLSEALQKAKDIENKIIGYYDQAAEQSKSLMADVPRQFNIVTKKRRNNRLPKLDELS